MKKVTKHTRAGKEGKPITCPICKVSSRIYHFDWTATECPSCKSKVDKYDWLLVEDYEPPIGN